jgi:hypothetical protein
LIYVSLIAAVTVIVMGMVIHSQIQVQRARDREAQRREAELLNRIMFLAGRPWVEPPREPEPYVPPPEPVVWSEAISMEG